MKKFIAAIDGLHYSETTAAYAVHLAKQNNAVLTGVFLDDFILRSYSVYEVMKEEGSNFGRKQKQLDAADAVTRRNATSSFEALCRQAGITFSIHHDQSVPLQELLREAVFADLVIIDKSENFAYTAGDAPSDFIRDLLPDIQCPVLIIPAAYAPIDKLIMLYDGSPSSIFAIRMFSCSLGQLKPGVVEVFSVKPPNKNLHLDKGRLMKEFIEGHFGKVKYKLLTGFPEVVIPRYLNKQKVNTMVVTGAYRRGMVSRWLHESMADVLMREINHPIFIAHT